MTLLVLTSGPPTIVDPSYVGLLKNAPTHDDDLRIQQINEDHRVFLKGIFKDFHLYLIVNHTRFYVKENSPRIISENSFEATILYKDKLNLEVAAKVCFHSPLAPLRNVVSCTHGDRPDAFELIFDNGKSEKFPLDLSLLNHYANNAPTVDVELRYIGIAIRNGRQAHDRLGEGHKKLQLILAEQSRRGGGRATSLLLYRPTPLNSQHMSFENTVEALEASLIQYFKTRPHNSEHQNFPNNKTELVHKIKLTGAKFIQAELEAPRNICIYSEHMQPKNYHKFRVSL